MFDDKKLDSRWIQFYVGFILILLISSFLPITKIQTNKQKEILKEIFIFTRRVRRCTIRVSSCSRRFFGLHGLKGRKLGVINCSSIYPRGNDWHNSVTRVSSMCYVQRGMLITCTGKLDAEQPLDKCVEKRSSFIEEAHASSPKTTLAFSNLNLRIADL